MGLQSIGNPYCNKHVRIEYQGQSIVGPIRDRCPECGAGDLDVSEGAYVALVGSTGGRLRISWSVLD
jgi:expansin (peptidoglycan-binding protein)